MYFEPIAIIGQACVLPGALNPEELWGMALSGKDVLSRVPDGYWRTDPQLVMAESTKDSQDRTWTDRGGYVQGFESVFDPEGFAISKDEILNFDPLVHWVLHTAREALHDAGYSRASRVRAGAILGNLSYPSHSLTKFSESILLDGLGEDFLGGKARELAGIQKPQAFNRFMSGLPAHILARALELNAGAFALDAACASSLYAIRLACDQLHDRRADVMLAGGVNRADDLIIHIGFCTLQAMSHSGRSRPFHRDADGLVPAEGAGFVVLKRLDDAVAAGDTILGVIRAVGISNDGRGHGLLVPSDEGQERAIRQGYEMSGLTPADISLVECHATGTPVGDEVEVRSMSRVFHGLKDIPIGTIKSNMGHPITVSGVAGLLKVLGAMKTGIRPPTLHVEEPIELLKDSPFRLLTESEPWTCEGVRRAVVNNFGFGGNNAHLIVEEWEETLYKKTGKRQFPSKAEIAIVGIGAVVSDLNGVEDFARALLSGKSRLRKQDSGNLAGFAESFELPLLGLCFPPADLDQTLPQQLLVLKATMEAIAEVDSLPRERTGVMVGMGCDGEVSRSAMCWRLPQWAKDWAKDSHLSNTEEWIAEARDSINPARKAPSILGAMPNITANRLNSQFDLAGSSFSVSAEELSGVKCLDLAIRALRIEDLDAAVVGAVDICCEPVHQAAAKEVLGDERQVSGDAAVTLILKRLEDARRDGDNIYAIIPDEVKQEADLRFGLEKDELNLTPLFGHAHAASGLLHVAAAALACKYRTIPARNGNKAVPWLISQGPRSAEVSINALGGESAVTRLTEAPHAHPERLVLEPVPRIHIYSGINRQGVMESLKQGRESEEGPARLVLVAADEEERSDLRDQARNLLEKDSPAKGQIKLGQGIYFRDTPVNGELAFVFTGSGGAYPGMGRDLILAFPEVMDEVLSHFQCGREAAGWIYEADTDWPQSPEKMLWGTSFLSQVHARFSRKIAGLVPDAVIGFSAGESNSLFAMEAWRDMDAMFQEFRDAGVFTQEVGGECAAIREAWKDHGVTEVNWINWGLLVPEKEVLTALETEPLVHLIIINAPGDVIIGGQADACERIVNQLGRKRAYLLGYNVACHCPEMKGYSDEWRRLHHRSTSPVPDVRFYTGATSTYYEPTADRAADALLGMATRTLDFPRMVKNAWNDGVRVFLEHGPRDSCTRWVHQALGDREHIAIPMDCSGISSLIQVTHAMAQLVAAGVPVQHKTFIDKLIPTMRRDGEPEIQGDSLKNRTRIYHVHPPKVQLTPFIPDGEGKTIEPVSRNDAVMEMFASEVISDGDAQVMAPAPRLLPVLMDAETGANAGDNGKGAIVEETRMPVGIMPRSDVSGEAGSPMGKILDEIVAQNTRISSIHKVFMAQQAQVHQRFLDLRQNALSLLVNTSGREVAFTDISESPERGVSALIQPAIVTTPSVSDDLTAKETPGGIFSTETPIEAKEPAQTRLVKSPVESSAAGKPLIPPSKDAEPLSSSKKPPSAISPAARQLLKPPARKPCGPTFSREQLEILASGKVSDILGPLFKIQDDYHRQVRLPEPPLLLVDRVTGLDAEPGSMGNGIMWTETDVKWDSWYINDGYMPAGITVEAGQCDLLLISYLGADFQNRGERIYRLLGCDLIYYGTPPRAGDTLCYEIHVDGHANMGDVRIFFFHYDCRINGELRLSVRNAQAGFFSDEELANSGGVLWDPETGEHKDDSDALVDPPAVTCTRREFSVDQVRAFSEGRVYECFGPGFEISETHSKTSKIPSGQMLLLDCVTRFDPKGGPWKRGYLRVENQISPDAWYLTCHFKNDPCMPGTLMSDACLQAMAFYLTAMGYTLDKDGWRFDPVPDETYHILCRGQVTPKSKRLIYEVFVEEVIDGPCPTIYADILGTCDGLKMLHIRRIGLRLVPDWPLDCWPHLLEGHVEKKPVARVGDMEFGYKSLLACAFGRPSDAFGEMGRAFDGPRHISRLPGPPYHFMTRVTKIEAGMGAMKTGESIEVEYDVPPGAWYFDENENRTMPFCVIMEVALQPCGWLAVFGGGPATSCEEALYFRNLDGTGTAGVEILPDSGTIRTRAMLTNIASISGVTLVNFDVECFVGERSVYTMKTGFGFFPKEALDQQVGLGATDEEVKWLDEPCDFLVDLTRRPDQYCGGEPRLPKPMLLMLDRVTGYWPEGGRKGLGRLRAEKTVNVSEWFFKAHFFHDPVQPGSLGVESMVQLLQFYMLHEGMDEEIEHPRFEPIALNVSTTWKYRGQVTPNKKRISVEMDIIEKGRDKQGSYAVAEAWLWADDLRIFHVKDLRMHIVSGSTPLYNEKDNLILEGKNALDPAVNHFSGDDQELAIKELVAHQAGVHLSSVHLVQDGKIALCDSMPLTLYPVVRKGEKNSVPLMDTGTPFFDFERMRAYGRKVWDIGPWLGEDIIQGLCRQFVRHVILEDPAAFKNIQGQSVLYLANHQVQVESMLFPMIIQVLTGRRTISIASADHLTGWIGSLDDFYYSYPGVTYPRNIVYFNQDDRSSLFDIINNLKTTITREGISVFLHVEGKLGVSCRNPVKILSSVFIDMAKESNLPIVPVLFAGGLPVKEMDATLDFPTGYGKQDYYVGRPILPDELQELPYASRRKYVMGAINNLGPPSEVETPNPPDPAFKEEVSRLMNQTGMTEEKAVLLKAMEGLAPTHAVDEQTRALIRAADEGRIKVSDNARGKWLAKMGQWLLKERGVDVVYSGKE